MKKCSLFKNPRFRYGSVSTLILCLLLAALIGANALFGALEKKNGWRVDFSFNGITTQSETTLQILEQLPHPVHIYALFPRGQEDGPLMELLDRYAAASPLVTWAQTDITLNPGLLTRFQSDTSEMAVSNDSLIVSCEATGRFKVLSPGDFVSLSLDYEAGTFTSAGYTYESRITSAINYVTRQEIPRIQVLQGHNELNESEIAMLTELLEGNNFEVAFISLADQTAELDASDMLAILSPLRDITDAEMEKITAFAQQGGSFLFTCDYTDPIDDMPNYQSLLRSYGFLPKDGLVIASPEEAGSYYSDMRIALIPTMLSTDVTYDLVASGVDTLLLVGSRGFEIPQQNDRNLDVSPVLTSGYKAYLRSLKGDMTTLEQLDEDELGPFALGLQARRVTTEGYISRAFVLGCSTLLTDSQVHAMTDSQEFILRVMEFLLDTEPVDLGIMAKAALRPQLSVESVTLGSVLLVALPLAVLAAAFVVLWPRRNR
ncbi:MAG: Gldg family protein [Clostridia bacterium]|nr:Gldg family protein [Clostridia bacterium]